MTDPVRIEIRAEPCPVLDLSNARYIEVWRAMTPDDRAQFVDGLIARSIMPTGTVNLSSSVPPVFQYPPWHTCVTSGEISGANTWGAVDEADRARAAMGARNTADVPFTNPAGMMGVDPLAAIRRILAALGYWKWVAIAAVVAGVVIVVARSNAARKVGYAAASARARKAR